MTSFRDLTSAAGGVWAVPDEWQQGRGAWGGLVVGAAVRAAVTAEESAAADRTVREVSVHMLAPLPAGPATVEVSSVRQGSGTSAWRVDIRDSAEETCATATVICGRTRGGDQPRRLDERITMPESEPWAAVPAVPIGPPIAPVFTAQLEFRPLTGLPYQGSNDDVVCWVRRDEPGPYDAPRLLALVDALWPATIVGFTEPRPIATIAFAASLHVDPASVDAREPLLHRGRLVAMQGGYATETRELWTADGRLAVYNSQVMAIIR